MTIRHLEVFIAVCETGNMSKAAKQLHIAQPSVSQTIAEIERYYNIRLFERLSRKLYITESGRELLSYARHITALFDEMEESINNKSAGIKLKIGATITVGTCFLNDIINRFEKSYPHIKTQIFVENNGAIQNMILNSTLDIGVVEGEIKSTDLVTIPVANDEIILVCSKNHELGNVESISIKDLSKYDFVLREYGSGTRELFEKALDGANVKINEKWICNNSEAIKNAVSNGQGLTAISRMLVSRELDANIFHEINIKEIKLVRNFHVIYHKNKYLSASLKNFISTCQGKD